MKAQIVSIGSEILIGQITDTNSVFLARQLTQNNIQVSQISSIADDAEAISEALDKALKHFDLVIFTGGLGPTKDDITKNTLARYFGSGLKTDPQVLADVEKLLASRGKTMLDLNRQQALVPEKCTVLRNPKGTAPGLWFERKGKIAISLPGVPWEMKAIFSQYALPALKKHFAIPEKFHKTILTTGFAESLLADTIKDWENQLPPHMALAYLPSPGVIRLRLDIAANQPEKARKDFETQLEKLKKYIPQAIFGYDNQTMQGVVGKLLAEKKRLIATAESCTGGYIAHLITSVPGCSAYFQGSVVAYSNQIKQNALGVEAHILDLHGAVSRPVVEQMAQGVRKRYQTHYAVATSGIAGPGGGTPEKPVGTVWIAACSAEKMRSEKFVFGSDRLRTIKKSAIAALNMLRIILEKEQQ